MVETSPGLDQIHVDAYESILSYLKPFPNTKLIAVSKRQPNSKIQAMYDLGQRDFGENYHQEWLGKKDQFPTDIRWHFIGSVQSKKVSAMSREGIYSIHGLGSRSSLEKFQQLESAPVGPNFVQINLERENQKGGLSEEELKAFKGEGLLQNIAGLMSIPPLEFTEIELAKHYARMKQLGDSLGFTQLSMGMSRDWKIALQEGATHIRVGSSLFGERVN